MKRRSTRNVHDVGADNLFYLGGQRRSLSAEATAWALLGLGLHTSQCLSVTRHVAVARALLAREIGTLYQVAYITKM